MRLAELMGTLSLATDAGTAMPEEHGLRAAAIASKLGELIGASTRDRADAFYLTQLKYAGCTADGDVAAAVFGDELDFGRETFGLDYGDPKAILPAVLRRARKGKGPLGGVLAMARVMSKLMGMKSVMRAHCEVADLLAARLGFDDAVRTALVQHSERWNGSGMPAGKKGDEIALPMRIAHVAFDVEIGSRIAGKDGSVVRVTQMRGKSLDPAICDAYLANVDAVAAIVEAPSAWAASLAAEPVPHREVDEGALDEALEAMAAFTDLKSRYTRGHSTAVSELAATAARDVGLPDEVVRDVRRAGLLHDLGRVAISTGIWDKPGALTDQERERVRMHTYVGERVLSRAAGLARVAEIACLAHERLDGSGYHRRLAAASCPPASRILAAADAYQAMISERPHRAPLSAEQAAAELTSMAAAGALCPDATRAVLAAAGHVVKKPARAHGLTDREVEVLRLLARGLTNKEIATTLEISTKTAGHHVQHIFEKLRVTTRAAAAMCAMQLGITA